MAIRQIEQRPGAAFAWADRGEEWWPDQEQGPAVDCECRVLLVVFENLPTAGGVQIDTGKCPICRAVWMREARL